MWTAGDGDGAGGCGKTLASGKTEKQANQCFDLEGQLNEVF